MDKNFGLNGGFATVSTSKGTYLYQGGKYYDTQFNYVSDTLPDQTPHLSVSVAANAAALASITSSPTKVLASGGGAQARACTTAVTNTTGVVQMLPLIIPANTVPSSGAQVDIQFSFSNNNSATAKQVYVTLGGIQVGPATSATTNVFTEGRLRLRTDGAGNLICSTVSADGATSTAYQSIAMDMTKDQQLCFWGSVGAVGDSMYLQGYTVSVTACPAAPAPAPVLPGKKIFYGVNSHPGYYPVVSGKQMVDLMKSLGMTVLRLDYNGPSNAAAIQAYAQAFLEDGGNLQVYCIVNGSMESSAGVAYANEAAAYAGNFALAAGAAQALGRYGVTMYGCGNELDSKSAGGVNIRTPAPPTWTAGSKAADFVNSVYPLFRGACRGMIDGVKSVMPNAICGSNAFTNASIYLSDCLWNGTAPDGSTGYAVCRWDVTDWHLYSQGDATNVVYSQGGGSIKFNQLQYLAQAYGKPIFISEFNPIGTTGATNDAGNATVTPQWMTSWVALKDKFNIASIMFYDLFDGTFQMIPADVPPYTLNQTGAAIKAFIQANPVNR